MVVRRHWKSNARTYIYVQLAFHLPYDRFLLLIHFLINGPFSGCSGWCWSFRRKHNEPATRWSRQWVVVTAFMAIPKIKGPFRARGRIFVCRDEKGKGDREVLFFVFGGDAGKNRQLNRKTSFGTRLWRCGGRRGAYLNIIPQFRGFIKVAREVNKKYLILSLAEQLAASLVANLILFFFFRSYRLSFCISIHYLQQVQNEFQKFLNTHVGIIRR